MVFMGWAHMCYNERFNNKRQRRELSETSKSFVVPIVVETRLREAGIPSNRGSSRAVNNFTSFVHTARRL